GNLQAIISTRGLISDVLNGGDSVSWVEGSGHPTMDALASGLELINKYNTVPVLSEIMECYITVIRGLSSQLASLRKHTIEKVLILTWVSSCE
ncbi:MAG: hypothetical protein HN348_30235, partial [Proteobacteria bacterium]|nr:hypothetical protein [Pseudomonadota bacterium]